MLNNVLKILKLTNRAIPIIKEVNPTLSKIKTKLSKNEEVIAPTGKPHPNSNLTFFK